VLAQRFTGTRYDCGNKDGFLAANIAFARKEGLLPPRRAGDRKTSASQVEHGIVGQRRAAALARRPREAPCQVDLQ